MIIISSHIFAVVYTVTMSSMVNDDAFAVAILAGLAVVQMEEEEEEERKKMRRRKMKKRTWWVRPWLQRRGLHGQFEVLMRELELEDVGSFINFTRVDPDFFYEIQNRIGHRIEKQSTHWRKPLPPGVRLAITLRYLATGDNYRSLQYGFRVAYNTISIFIPEVCQAIVDEYAEEVMELPRTEDKWLEIAREFETKWNLPNCIGALDGKHVAIKCPPSSGSIYYNYKHFYSIVLMALVDANYKFIYINVGAAGGGSDGGVFADTMLRKLLEADDLGLPPHQPLPGGTRPVPFFIVGDEAFPLRTWLMKPIPRRGLHHRERIYNYRISRARRVVENAFGLLANRFRCLLDVMPQKKPERVETIVMAACTLHNLIINRRGMRRHGDADREDPETHQVIPGNWRTEPQMPDLGQAPLRGNTATKAAKDLREYLVEYFNSPAGSVPWQDRMI